MWQIILIALLLCISVLPIIALVDIVNNNFKGDNKVIWILVVLFLPFFGAISYFIIGKKQKITKDKS